jgi:uncharacterized protein YndB with AHSA1/START domain
MPHSFQIAKEFEFDASPEQLWDAVATGPGIDAWFMGHSEVEPRAGGDVRFSLGDFTTVGTVTAWEPLRRFAYRSAAGPDGEFMAFDYLIDGRDGGTTVLRMVQSGMLGDDWEAEYDALERGWNLYLHTIGEYISHFDGRTLRAVSAHGAQADDEDKAWELLLTGLGRTATPALGDTIRLPVIDRDGVVDYVEEKAFIGVRTDNGLYRFAGRLGGMSLGHHILADGDGHDTDAWHRWLIDLYA